jgi:hypothetical protein
MENENLNKQENPSIDINFRWSFENGKLRVRPIVNQKAKSDKEKKKNRIAKQSKRRNRKH